MMSPKFIKKAPKAKGFASILAIGRAEPDNIVEQSAFPNFFFRSTNSEHLINLKEKFQRICEKTAIKKRHFVWNEELLMTNPCLCTFMDNPFNIRQDVVIREIPKLGAAAATKAINEWGQPKSRITHIIFCTTSGVDMPGADFQLIKILDLNPNIERIMLYQLGCFAGATTLRLAKCLAESRKDARVLIVCAETTIMHFRAPSEEHQEDLIAQALFADGASAVIVGADPNEEAQERASFEIYSTSQVLLPGSEGAITGRTSEGGLKVTLQRDIAHIVSKNIGKCLEEAFTPLGISDWNSIFWVLHPGGRAIIDKIEETIGLKAEKLQTSRQVLAEYGNIISVCVHFILDEIRKKSTDEGKLTTGEGLEWGVLFGFGPGLTIETVILRSIPL